MITLTNEPVANAQMLIRRPAHEVFQAFVDPAVTTRFWFSKSSGKLEAGETVRWDWEMYGAHSDVVVKEIEENKRILIDWSSPVTTVEWVFTTRGENETYVTVKNWGFTGDGDSIMAQALDSTEGFNIVLCGLKALLEHDLELNLIADKYPDGLVEGWESGS